MTRDQLNELLAKPHIAARNLDLLPVQCPAQSPEPKQAPGNESVATEKRKDRDPIRYCVRVESRRKRLLDPDNLIAKYFVDSCRYAGLLPGDSASEIDYQITQTKVGKNEPEETIIEIEKISSK